MKLCRYAVEGDARIGLIEGEAVVDLTSRLPGLGSDMKDLIRRWSKDRATIETLRVQHDHELGDVHLLAPITRPGKIWGLGLNYMEHVKETGRTPPTHPTFFAMAQTSIVGPGEPILIPSVSDQVDYEAELVFVVGETGRHISEDTALNHVFGYCCGNDVSVRDWQRRTGQFSIGKSFDTHAPIGPWIVTPDELEVGDIAVRGWVNDELRQNGRTSQMQFDVAYQLAHLSQAMTMEPGDVIFTGTPAGVGAAFDPPKFLKSGDTVTVEIEGIGSLTNPVAPEQSFQKS